MGWLREGRREGGDEGFLGMGVLDVEDGAVWIPRCKIVYIAVSCIAFALSGSLISAASAFSYLCVDVFQALESGQLGNSNIPVATRHQNVSQIEAAMLGACNPSRGTRSGQERVIYWGV